MIGRCGVVALSGTALLPVAINQKLARAVGWPAPPAVLLQATEVIE